MSVATAKRSHRGTIHLEDAEVINQVAYPGGQYVIRLRAPAVARRAEPGSFAHVTCDPALPMRRPLSLLRVEADEGWIEILYKVHGDGLRHLASRRAGDRLSVLGPIGKPFRPDPARPRALLLGGGVGIPPVVYLAENQARLAAPGWSALALLGSELPFPFEVTRSRLSVGALGDKVRGAMAELEALGVPSRLVSNAGLDQAFEGYVTAVAERWLQSLTKPQKDEVTIYACGPTPMLAAVAALAHRHDVPAQVSLEEYMACAVGGCAGCTVPVTTSAGVAMKRVCVDGPVFLASEVFPQTA